MDIGSQAVRLQAVLEGFPPPWDLFGVNCAQDLADFVRLPPTYQFTDRGIGPTLDLVAIASLGGAAAPIFWLIEVMAICGTTPAERPTENIVACLGLPYQGKQGNSTKISSNTSAQLSSDTKCQSRVSRLYCIILFLKTAAVLTCIKYQDSKLQLAMKFIWFMVERLVEELTTPQATTGNEESLEKSASVLLVALVVSLLRQLIPTDAPMCDNASKLTQFITYWGVLHLVSRVQLAPNCCIKVGQALCERTLRGPLPHETLTQTEACESIAASYRCPACLQHKLRKMLCAYSIDVCNAMCH